MRAQLKGSDSLLYHALKACKVAPALHWVAAGHVWPVDKTVKLGEYHESVSPSLTRQSLSYTYGSQPTLFRVARHRRASRSASEGSGSLVGAALGMMTGIGTYGRRGSRSGPRSAAAFDPEEDDDEYLDDIVVAGGALPLQETEIVILTARDRSVFKGSVSVVSKGKLEEVQVNLLLVFYVE